MRAEELRIGNLHYYQMQDSMDERQRWLEPSLIDIEDLVHLNDNPDDPDYLPMELNLELIHSFGFENHPHLKNHYILKEKNSIGEEIILLHIYWVLNQKGFYVFGNGVGSQINQYFQYAHELQNLYKAITKDELPTCYLKLSS